MLIIKIYNDGSGDKHVASYDWVVKGTFGEEIARGRVENHKREQGWQELIRAFAKQVTAQQAAELLAVTGAGESRAGIKK